jgi:TolB-like protein/Flp pilus assembly protein TadD
MRGTSQYSFGPFRFDVEGRMLFREQQDLGLPPKAADVLLLLLTRAGSVVEKSALLDSVWAGRVVGEGSLTRTISILRKALGGDDASRAYIATVSKRGYRFVAPLDARTSGETSGERVMLAVLPFANAGSRRGHDFFTDGLTEEMIAQLSTLNPERLGVIARTSSLMFKGSRGRVADIGRELGVYYLLEGTVRRSRGRVRVSARLIQVSDETQVWGSNYERPAGDVLRLQAEVAQAVAAGIRVQLAPRGVRRIDAVHDLPPQVFETLLKARHYLNQRTEAAMRRSIAQFEAVLQRCPDCAPAWAGIADANVMLACRGMVPAKETFRRSAAAAGKALELDGELGDAHASLAHVRLHDWDWVGLDARFRHAIELSPSLAIVNYWYAEYLMNQGRRDAAIAAAEDARHLDPLSPVIGSAFAMILYLARDYDRASHVLVDAIETSPGHFLPHLRLGLVRVQQRRFSDAIRELRAAARLADGSTETRSMLAMAHAASGDLKGAMRIAKQLESARGRRYVLPYNIAKIHAAAGDRTRAFEWLEVAYEGGNPDLIELNSEPVFDGLRGDRHFKALMRRIGWNA